MHYLWRAVDHEGEVLESYVTKRWDCFSSKKKINEIVRFFPQFKGNESGLENIISEQKKIHNQE